MSLNIFLSIHIFLNYFYRIQNRILLRIQELSDLPMNMSANLRMNAEIELRALRLINLQTQVCLLFLLGFLWFLPTFFFPHFTFFLHF